MDELMNGSCSINTTYGSCCNQLNKSYSDILLDDIDINYTDDFEFNYASQPFDEFMDSNHEEVIPSDIDSTKTEQKEQNTKTDGKLLQHETKESIKLNTFHRQNLIIWDWDDTIFPTTSFRMSENKKDKQFMSKLNVLVSYIERIFIKMIKIYGSSNIIIVTNASETWINTCLNVDIIQDTFMNFQNLLKNYNITTMSAATQEIIKKYPQNHHKWKEIVFTKYFLQCFNDIHDDDNKKNNDYDNMRINCITSIGDGLSEYKASHIASKYIKNRILNRIRLKPNPSLNDMIFQLKEILTMIDQFGNNIDDIDMDYSSLLSLTSSDTTC